MYSSVYLCKYPFVQYIFEKKNSNIVYACLLKSHYCIIYSTIILHNNFNPRYVHFLFYQIWLVNPKVYDFKSVDLVPLFYFVLFISLFCHMHYRYAYSWNTKCNRYKIKLIYQILYMCIYVCCRNTIAPLAKNIRTLKINK